MRGHAARRLIAAGAAVVGLAGCGTGPAAQDDGNRGSVDPFVATATRGLQTNFDPLTSPGDAIRKGDLVVEGRLAEVLPGIRFESPDPAFAEAQGASYMTLVIDVTTVIDGNAGGRVHVVAPKSPVATIEQLSALNTRPSVVAVLDDVTSWKPAANVRVVRPATVPADAALYAPYTDGLWLQGEGDAEMHALGARREGLARPWGEPKRVEDLSLALRRASGPR
jgi:hypothetical protein